MFYLSIHTHAIKKMDEYNALENHYAMKDALKQLNDKIFTHNLVLQLPDFTIFNSKEVR